MLRYKTLWLKCKALLEKKFDFRFFDSLDFQLMWRIRWYYLCEDDGVHLNTFRPGFVTVRPYDWSTALVDWWNPAKRRRGVRAVDEDVDEAYMGPEQDEEDADPDEAASSGSAENDDAPLVPLGPLEVYLVTYPFTRTLRIPKPPSL